MQNVDGSHSNRMYIQGETKHFDFVCEGVVQGIKDLNVQPDISAIFVFYDNTMQRCPLIEVRDSTETRESAAIAAIKTVYPSASILLWLAEYKKPGLLSLGQLKLKLSFEVRREYNTHK
jgi:6,7-dimethyl-8-ribityllumazine synthase